MKKLIILALICSSCGYEVKEHRAYVTEGYECTQRLGQVTMKICDTKEECNLFCEALNK